MKGVQAVVDLRPDSLKVEIDGHQFDPTKILQNGVTISAEPSGLRTVTLTMYVDELEVTWPDGAVTKTEGNTMTTKMNVG